MPGVTQYNRRSNCVFICWTSFELDTTHKQMTVCHKLAPVQHRIAGRRLKPDQRHIFI